MSSSSSSNHHHNQQQQQHRQHQKSSKRSLSYHAPPTSHPSCDDHEYDYYPSKTQRSATFDVADARDYEVRMLKQQQQHHRSNVAATIKQSQQILQQHASNGNLASNGVQRQHRREKTFKV